MDIGVASIVLAGILGASQVISSLISNRNGRLRDKNEALKNQNRRFAKQVYFMRVLEESVIAELCKSNTDYQPLHVKRQIRKAVFDYLGYKYESNDSEIKDSIVDIVKPIEGQDISAYIESK